MGHRLLDHPVEGLLGYVGSESEFHSAFNIMRFYIRYSRVVA